MIENKTMTLRAHEKLVSSLEVSNVTGVVASASHDNYVKLWKWSTFWICFGFTVNGIVSSTIYVDANNKVSLTGLLYLFRVNIFKQEKGF